MAQKITMEDGTQILVNDARFDPFAGWLIQDRIPPSSSMSPQRAYFLREFELNEQPLMMSTPRDEEGRPDFSDKTAFKYWRTNPRVTKVEQITV